MKKKILTLGLLLFMGVNMFADEPLSTTDCFTISDVELAPGGAAAKITVSLSGSATYYTAYNMDIHLPVGIDVALKPTTNKADVSMKKPSLYPYTEEEEDDETVKVYTHSLQMTYGVVGERVLRVACYSNINENFTATSGALFTINLKALPCAKPGAATITIDGAKLVTSDGTGYKVADKNYTNVTVGTTSTVPFTISEANKYSTCVLPFDATLPSGVKAYICKSYAEGFVSLKEASALSAYTPYLVYSEAGYSGSLSGTVDPSKYVEVANKGLLYGAIVPQQKNAGYVLQNLTDGVKFYNMNGATFSIPSGKCWLEIPSDVKSVGFNFDDPTSIRSISCAINNTLVYDLQGKRVQMMEPGKIYIINNQKYLKIK